MFIYFFELLGLSNTLQSPTGLMGFAQKTSIKRAGDGVGKTCTEFLGDTDTFKWVLAGMMCEASTESLFLIRIFDKEGVDTTSINIAVSHFLDHIHWLFFEDGVLKIHGHTAFIIEWIESKPHHYIWKGESKCIGGSKIADSVIRKAMLHMQAWTKLAAHTLQAEFPSFGLISCFTAFQLPRERPQTICPDGVARQIMRLGVVFGKSKLLSQFKNYWHHAFVAYQASNFTLSYWDAWMCGMQRGGDHGSDALEHVCLRGEAFAAATSKVEQSFSRIDDFLGKKRLNGSDGMENMYINLLMASDMNDGELASVVDGAMEVWKACFPSRHTRLHTQTQRDKLIPHVGAKLLPTEGHKLTEKAFLHGITTEVAKSSKRGASEALLEAEVPLWEQGHENELAFQKGKRRKREVEACLQDHLLPDERNEDLQAASVAEKIRQAKSYVGRLQERLKYKMKTTAVPPTPAELFRSKVYLDDGIILPHEWLATLTRVEATITETPHVATIFVADNP